MGKKVDDDTSVILRKLAIILPAFYAIYYVVAVILFAAFSGGCGNEYCKYEMLPFYFDETRFKPGGRRLAFLVWLSQVLTFVASTGLMYHVVASTSKSWDYACTLGFCHVILSCAVNAAFPTNWIWWVTLILSTFGLSSLGEFANYYRDMKDIVVSIQ